MQDAFPPFHKQMDCCFITICGIATFIRAYHKLQPNSFNLNYKQTIGVVKPQ